MARVLVKSGVAFTVIAPAGVCILQALKAAARALDRDLTITSACEGEHSGPDDPHHRGCAYDIRSHDIDPAMRAKVLDTIMSGLARDRFYGFLEARGTSNEHYHVQLRKGASFTIEDFLASA